ncbi:MAG TPA: phage protease [Polyangiaceae bacterium]|jgi:hypothetical protein
MRFDSTDIEKNASGVPVAFRMWRAGVNPTDHGDHVLTERSVSGLLATQRERGNLFSIDVDHMSLNAMAPIENHKAVGWFTIEERDGDIWAVNVEWTDDVRAGLAKDPPEWRYFSPAYDTKKDSGEIVRLLNLALTNNPATHNVTALATATAFTTEKTMSAQSIEARVEARVMQHLSKREEQTQIDRILAALPAEERGVYKDMTLDQVQRMMRKHYPHMFDGPVAHGAPLTPTERESLDKEMGVTNRTGWLAREVGSTLEFNPWATAKDADRALASIATQRATIAKSRNVPGYEVRESDALNRVLATQGVI